MSKHINIAIDRINADRHEGGYIYRAEETDLDYTVDADDLAELGRMIAEGEDDAYSLWCSSYGAELTSLGGWTVGDDVEGGDTDDDHDTGSIVAVRRDLDSREGGVEVEVAWDSGVRTWQTSAAIRAA